MHRATSIDETAAKFDVISGSSDMRVTRTFCSAKAPEEPSRLIRVKGNVFDSSVTLMLS
jgi:hypothetical protein